MRESFKVNLKSHLFDRLKLVSFLLVMASSGSGYAQSSTSVSTIPGKKFISTIEVFGGPPHGNYWGKTRAENQVLNLAYMFGVGVSHQLTSRFDVTTRLISQMKGYKIDYNTDLYYDNVNPTPVRVTIKGKYRYVSLEVLGRYYFDKYQNFYSGLGGYVSQLFDAKIYSRTGTRQGATLFTNYAKDPSIQDFDYGLAGVIGYRISVFPKFILNTQLVGNLGLSDIVKKEFPNEGPIRIYSISLTVGINLNP